MILLETPALHLIEEMFQRETLHCPSDVSSVQFVQKFRLQEDYSEMNPQTSSDEDAALADCVDFVCRCVRLLWLPSIADTSVSLRGDAARLCLRRRTHLGWTDVSQHALGQQRAVSR